MAEHRLGITMNGVTGQTLPDRHRHAGRLRDPDAAAARMRPVLAVHGIGG